MPGSRLLSRIQEIAEKAHLPSVAVALYDFDTALRFSYQGDRWYHAASTFKVGVLFALLKASEEKVLQLDDHLEVRNRFVSIADGSTFRIDRERDGDGSVHKRIGRSMQIIDLARAMIVRSSNLATNLLIDFVGVDYIRQRLASAGISGLEVRRGVEDTAAHQKGINNEATVDGLLRLFRLFTEPSALTEEARQAGIDILLQQEFRSMIPARLPEGVRVAHKTGEISTHAHDAGIIFRPDRAPYVLAIMSETSTDTPQRNRAIADISLAVYKFVSGSSAEEKLSHE